MLSYFTDLMVDAILDRADAFGTYTDGEFSKSTTTQTPIKIIAPQPVRENDLNMLADGEKASDYRVTWVFSDTELHTRDSKYEADQIIYDGAVYKVVQVNDRDPLGNFKRVVMRDINGV